MRKVPELSLLSFVNGSDQERANFVDGLMTGLKDYGFIILVDHIIDTEVIKNSYTAVENFFKLSKEKKMKYVCSSGGGQRGYTAFGVEHAKNTDVPDLKEFWHVGREVSNGHKFKDLYPDNIWPTEIEGFEKDLQNLYDSLDETSRLLLDAIGIGLDVPQDYFRNMISDGNSILRPIHYPPVGPDAPDGAVRAAQHEDINLITMLIGATASGLELLDHDGKWLPVNTKENQLVVDSGDMLSRITNGVLPATTHRVVNPEDRTSDRYSMPFFVHPNPDTTLECISSCLGDGAKYPPINSHEFLLQRLKEIGLVKK